MPRPKQGGARQGTPGRAYANRTDLQQAPDMSKNTAAAGGMTAPAMPRPGAFPEDTPMLTDPTQRPMEPITDGLPSGPGRDQTALTGFDPRVEETKQMATKWYPILSPLAEDPETPDSVRSLVRYLRGS